MTIIHYCVLHLPYCYNFVSLPCFPARGLARGQKEKNRQKKKGRREGIGHSPGMRGVEKLAPASPFPATTRSRSPLSHLSAWCGELPLPYSSLEVISDHLLNLNRHGGCSVGEPQQHVDHFCLEGVISLERRVPGACNAAVRYVSQRLPVYLMYC